MCRSQLLERATELQQIAVEGPTAFSSSHLSQLNKIDDQLTDIMLIGECLSTKVHRNRQFWSPDQ